MIDIHRHLGRFYFSREGGSPNLSAEDILRTMDKLGVEKSCLMPIENPEACEYYSLTSEAIEASRKYPERFVPFCSVDPRCGGKDIGTHLRAMIEEYMEQGGVGFGEMKPGLAIDDYRSMKIYEVCGQLQLPLLLHIDHLRNYDKPGLPGFERMLAQFPSTIFIAHAQCWWGEISKEVDYSILYPEDPIKESGYPRGKIKPGGRVGYLLRKFPNLYADISAGSGYIALSRDTEFTQGFLKRNHSKLLLGTDYLFPGQEEEYPIIDLLRKWELDSKVFKAITKGNVQALLGI